MNTEDYLKRIKCEKLTEVSLENLRKLHSNHLLNISFENFSLALNEYVKIDLEPIYDKVINKKRGGFCFELNQLFGWLLRELGYDMKFISCRTFPASIQKYYPWNSHIAIMINLNSVSYLLDVGFSFSFRYPLEFIPTKIHLDVVGRYRIDVIDDELDTNGKRLENTFTLNRTAHDLNDQNLKWQILYKFNTAPREINEFQYMLDWSQSKECGRIYNRSLCLKQTENSIKMLIGYNFTTMTFKNGVEISKEESIIEKEDLIRIIENELNVKICKEFIPRNIQQ